MGRYVGREAIRTFFMGAGGIFWFAIHHILNGHIDVDGDTARAQWFLFRPCTEASGNRAMWRGAIDYDQYRRVDGAWMFSRQRSVSLMNAAFEKGWAPT